MTASAISRDDPLGLPPGWAEIVAKAVPYERRVALAAFVVAAERAGAVYPPAADRFRALELTPPDAVRVVILGQDPYHGPRQAHGLAFSVPTGVRPPPSLANIHKELASDIGITRPASGSLDHWARQGVLLLNTVLSVAHGQAGSHARQGWEAVTDAIVAHVAAGPRPVAFLLWGSHAQAKADAIPALADPRHLVLRSVHPSPLSAYRGFFGSRPFSQVDAFLTAHGDPPIDW
ncbi:uracil-DNA glycosylase [Sphingomonas sp. RS2018]